MRKLGNKYEKKNHGQCIPNKKPMTKDELRRIQ